MIFGKSIEEVNTYLRKFYLQRLLQLVKTEHHPTFTRANSFESEPITLD